MNCIDCGDKIIRYAAKNKLTNKRCDSCRNRHANRVSYEKRKAKLNANTIQ